MTMAASLSSSASNMILLLYPSVKSVDPMHCLTFSRRNCRKDNEAVAPMYTKRLVSQLVPTGIASGIPFSPLEVSSMRNSGL